MTDLDLIRVFLPYISAQMTAYGYPVTIKQSYQPDQTGANTAATLYFYIINSRNVGHPKRQTAWNDVDAKMVYTDIQRTETTFQLTGLIPYDASSTYTPLDYMHMASHIMQSKEFADTLKANNIAILKIGEIRNPYFQNDKDLFQASPSFDFTLAYNRQIVRDGNVLTSIEFAVDRI